MLCRKKYQNGDYDIRTKNFRVQMNKNNILVKKVMKRIVKTVPFYDPDICLLLLVMHGKLWKQLEKNQNANILKNRSLILFTNTMTIIYG